MAQKKNRFFLVRYYFDHNKKWRPAAPFEMWRKKWQAINLKRSIVNNNHCSLFPIFDEKKFSSFFSRSSNFPFLINYSIFFVFRFFLRLATVYPSNLIDVNAYRIECERWYDIEFAAAAVAATTGLLCVCIRRRCRFLFPLLLCANAFMRSRQCGICLRSDIYGFYCVRVPVHRIMSPIVRCRCVCALISWIDC